MKRADYIRDLDDEDLAQWFCDLISGLTEDGCDLCPARRFCYMTHTGAIDWMQEDIDEYKE